VPGRLDRPGTSQIRPRFLAAPWSGPGGPASRSFVREALHLDPAPSDPQSAAIRKQVIQLVTLRVEASDLLLRGRLAVQRLPGQVLLPLRERGPGHGVQVLHGVLKLLLLQLDGSSISSRRSAASSPCWPRPGMLPVGDGLHLPASLHATPASTWVALVSGFGDLRHADGIVSFAPRLPGGAHRARVQPHDPAPVRRTGLRGARGCGVRVPLHRRSGGRGQ
jgi:hypothetical protein